LLDTVIDREIKDVRHVVSSAQRKDIG